MARRTSASTATRSCSRCFMTSTLAPAATHAERSTAFPHEKDPQLADGASSSRIKGLNSPENWSSVETWTISPSATVSGTQSPDLYSLYSARRREMRLSKRTFLVFMSEVDESDQAYSECSPDREASIAARICAS